MANISNTQVPKTGTLRGTHSVHIYYQDTDLSGSVYHSNYLRYFERARAHLIGLDFLNELMQKNVMFVLTEANLKYKRPARHGDCLSIRTDIHFSRSPLLPVEHIAENTATGELLVESSLKLATINEKHQPIRLPDWVIERFINNQKYV